MGFGTIDISVQIIVGLTNWEHSLYLPYLSADQSGCFDNGQETSELLPHCD
jgi:hypothetical protein